MWASCAETDAVPRPLVASCCVPLPKLIVAFEIVPLGSDPNAVKVIASGAEPDEAEAERLVQTGG